MTDKPRSTAEIRKRCRELFEQYIPLLQQIADDPDSAAKDRAEALRILAEYAPNGVVRGADEGPLTAFLAA